MRFVVVCLSLLVISVACSGPSGDVVSTATSPSPTVTPTVRPTIATATPRPTYTPRPSPSPTVEPTSTPIPEGPFSRTQAQFIDYSNQPFNEELRSRLGETLIADIAAYLDAVIDPDMPLDEQQDALSHIAADLPGWDWATGEITTVDVDPEVGLELAIIARMGGVQLLYGRYVAGGWRVSPVPWPDDVEIDPNVWPDSVEVRDLTGDGQSELLATYRFVGASGYWDYVQVFRWTGADFVLLFRADLLSWAGESRYALEPDSTQAGAMQIVLIYPHLYKLGFDHKMVGHPIGRQIWRWDPGARRFVLAEATVDLEHSAVWGSGLGETMVEDRLRWLVNEGETRFRSGEYEQSLSWYETALDLAEAEAWEPVKREPHWAAYAAFRRAQVLLLLGQTAEGLPAMQAVAAAWEGDLLGKLARAFLNGYGDGTMENAGHRGILAMYDVNLKTHFYYERSGALRFPMNAEGILFSGVASLPPAPEWPRVGTFN